MKKIRPLLALISGLLLVPVCPVLFGQDLLSRHENPQLYEEFTVEDGMVSYLNKDGRFMLLFPGDFQSVPFASIKVRGRNFILPEKKAFLQIYSLPEEEANLPEDEVKSFTRLQPGYKESVEGKLAQSGMSLKELKNIELDGQPVLYMEAEGPINGEESLLVSYTFLRNGRVVFFQNIFTPAPAAAVKSYFGEIIGQLKLIP